MKTFTVGFIGAGNMATAIIEGAIKKEAISAQQIIVYDIDSVKASELNRGLSVGIANNMFKLVYASEIIIIAVKPNMMVSILTELKDFIGNKTIVSIAAGWSSERIRSILGKDKKVLRLMPNTPLMVGEGMTVFEVPHSVSDDEYAFIENIFASIGRVEQAPEKLMDAVTAVSGSGPAYVFLFIEALADAGVLCGLPRTQALKLASQTVLGAAKMVLETGSHPGVLKDAVCSPCGTTIEAVKSLENDGLRAAVINATEKCANKSRSLIK